MNHLDEKDLLARALRERAGDVSGQPVSFQAVRGSARRLQRRRTVVAGAVAAAVATLALPAGIAIDNAVRGPGGPSTEPQFAATPSTQHSASPTDAAEPAPTPRADGTFAFTLQGLPAGAPTTVRHILGGGRTLVTADGAVELGRAYSQMTPYRDGWLALAGTENGWENHVLGEDLSIERSTLGGEGVVRDVEGTRVLYVQRDFNVPGRTVVVDEPSETSYDREQMTWDVPDDGDTVRPVGYLGEETVVFQATASDGRTTVYTASDGGDPVPLEPFLRATAASEATGLVAGQVSYDPAGSSCWAVVDPRRSTTDPVWRTCDYSLWQFSPDGSHVVASAPDLDGFGPGSLVVLDTQTWEPVVTFEPDRRSVVALAQVTWEDADSVVAVVADGNDFGLVRAELDGRLESVSDVYPSRDMTLPLWLAEQPRG